MDYKCLKINKSQGEYFRTRLLELNAFDTEREIEREGEYLYIPLKSDFDIANLNEFKEFKFEFSDRDCKKRVSSIHSYHEFLKDTMPKTHFELLPRSFDSIGSIALIKIPEPLINYKRKIGESIIEANKRIKSVYISKGIHDEYRLHDLEHIAGIDNSVTRHTEFGIVLELDVRKVYFSPRLATERYRIATQIKKDELIVDMFAGVGPFSVMIAKIAAPAKIYAIDINPEAVMYLKKNMKLNSTTTIEPFEGDAQEVITMIPNLGNISRVIMNLPHSGHKFLPAALEVLDVSGMIHYYEIMDINSIDTRKSDIISYGNEQNVEIEIMNTKRVHSYSPKDALIGFDIKIDKSRPQLI